MKQSCLVKLDFEEVDKVLRIQESGYSPADENSAWWFLRFELWKTWNSVTDFSNTNFISFNLKIISVWTGGASCSEQCRWSSCDPTSFWSGYWFCCQVLHLHAWPFLTSKASHAISELDIQTYSFLSCPRGSCIV